MLIQIIKFVEKTKDLALLATQIVLMNREYRIIPFFFANILHKMLNNLNYQTIYELVDTKGKASLRAITFPAT